MGPFLTNKFLNEYLNVQKHLLTEKQQPARVDLWKFNLIKLLGVSSKQIFKTINLENKQQSAVWVFEKMSVSQEK